MSSQTTPAPAQQPAVPIQASSEGRMFALLMEMSERMRRMETRLVRVMQHHGMNADGRYVD